MAPNFVEATSNMYNTITDYVLGPMHGHSAPQSSTPRPVLQPAQTPVTRCQDDSDSDDDGDDNSPPGAAQLISSASRSQSDASSTSAQDTKIPLAASSQGEQTQAEVLLHCNDWQPREAQSSLAANSIVVASPNAASDQQVTADTSSATQQSTANQSASSDARTSEDEQASQEDQAQHGWQAYAGSGSRFTNLLAAPVLLGQAAKMLMQQPFSKLPTSARHLLSQNGSQQRPSQSSQKPHTDSSGSNTTDGKQRDGMQDGRDGVSSQTGGAAMQKQRRFLLTFKDPQIEAEYCVWQARERIKVSMSKPACS